MKRVVEEKKIVPMVDLKRQFQEVKEEVLHVITEVLERGQYILGPKVAEFEKKMAGYLGMSEAIGVASCTDALHLSLDGFGIGEGDEVIQHPLPFLLLLRRYFIQALNLSL